LNLFRGAAEDLTQDVFVPDGAGVTAPSSTSRTAATSRLADRRLTRREQAIDLVDELKELRGRHDALVAELRRLVEGDSGD
jgi:hypothetical protein